MVDFGPGKGEEVFFWDNAAVAVALLNITEGKRVASLFAATPELVVGDITASSFNPLDMSFSIATKRWLRRLV